MADMVSGESSSRDVCLIKKLNGEENFTLFLYMAEANNYESILKFIVHTESNILSYVLNLMNILL